MLPSKLLDLVDLIATCSHTIDTRLDFACASGSRSTERIPLQEYIPIKQELCAQNNVSVKRFRIYEWPAYAGVAMSVRDIGDVDDAIHDDLSVKDDAYERFAKRVDNQKIQTSTSTSD
ncbi:hypothetical protein DPMN_113512 [Dreissena polymorpha]|uniref:Uncharacterized protein n=1 Tax=Dreissena polymorpha TaxID=45954 RepID=A0A9D4KIC3_DREPO|nr:hypothetical protein DPMN_113512 [Dreissena polymorpha]